MNAFFPLFGVEDEQEDADPYQEMIDAESRNVQVNTTVSRAMGANIASIRQKIENLRRF